MKDIVRYHIKRIVKNKQIQENAKRKRLGQYLEKEIIFIHIPKAAGVSINSSIYKNYGCSHAPVGFYIENLGIEVYRSLFTFTFVRHPIDRFISAFEFLKKGGMHSIDRDFSDYFLLKSKDVNEFSRLFFEEKKIREYIHFKRQSDFLTWNGNIEVDFIGKFENLEEDFSVVCNAHGIQNNLQKLNVTQKKESIDLEQENIDRLTQYYNSDFENFNYDHISK